MSSRPITRILDEVTAGSEGAKERLLEAVHDQLRTMAKRHVSKERPGNSLLTMDLVNEVYLKILGSDTPHFENRRHFFGAAARAMWQILVDHHRPLRKKQDIVSLENIDVPRRLRGLEPEELLDLESAFVKLERLDPRVAEVVRLRTVFDMKVREVADLLGVSERTVHNDWRQGSARLSRWVKDSDETA